ncbi:MAG: hypothetical protein OXG78_14570 [Chloroflexi bacterium]|nr:hypothetical protein [Chloroflexota bacterium]
MPQPLKVWLPAPLISDESGPAFQLLSEHTAQFSEDNGIPVEFRVKNSSGVGGIMSTIRAGKEVAPGALPDAALIRRRDLTPTQASQYLQSMETLFSSSVLNDLAGGVEFGQIPFEGERALFGFPFLFDLLVGLHAQPLLKTGTRLSFADVLANEAEFLFPAARANGLNQTFYHQYLAAGGAIPGSDVAAINEEALQKVLQFYDDLARNGLVSPDVLTYQSPADYRNDFINRGENLQLAIFSASDYLSMIQEQEAALLATEIPTADANGSSILNGWLWVIVTPDRNRQASAARFIEWMMEPAFHAGFALELHHLPSQPAILSESLPSAADTALFARLLADSVLPLPEGEGGAVPRLIQEALKQVLHAEATASQATQDALSQFAER